MLLTWVNPPHRLAVGREQQDGAVVDDDLDLALVVLVAKLVVLDRVARLRVAVGAGEEREHVLGEVGGLDGDREEGSGLGRTPVPEPAQPDETWNLRRILLVGRSKMLLTPRLLRERHENEPATDQQRYDEGEYGVADDGVPQHRRDGADVLRITRVAVRPGRDEVAS